MTRRTTKRPDKKRIKAGQAKAATQKRIDLFVQVYIRNGGNGKQAAIEAGYSPKTAESQASRLLRNVKVSKVVALNRAQVVESAMKKTELSVERTLVEVSRLGFHDPRRMLTDAGAVKPMKEWDDEIAACVASMEVEEITVNGVAVGTLKKVKFWDKNSALEKAMKHLGQYAEDNKQRSGVKDMSDEQLQRQIERLSKEHRASLH